MRGCVCRCARDAGGTTISARGFPRPRGRSGRALLLCAGPNVSRQGHSCPQPLVSLGQWLCVWWVVELACLDQILLSSSTFSASLPPSELLPSSSSPLRTCQVSCYMTINPCGWITISHKFTFKLHKNLTRPRSRVEGHSLASPPPPRTERTHGIELSHRPTHSVSGSLPSAAHLLWVVIAVDVVTVGMASGTLYVYPMTLQDCCFFEKSK